MLSESTDWPSKFKEKAIYFDNSFLLKMNYRNLNREECQMILGTGYLQEVTVFDNYPSSIKSFLHSTVFIETLFYFSCPDL